MKFFATILALMLTLICTACAGDSNQPAAEKTAEIQKAPEIKQDDFKVTFFVGTVMKIHQGEASQVAIGDVVSLDDTLKTESQSTVNIQYKDQGLIRISENCSCTVKSLVGESDGETRLKLNKGQLTVTLSKLKKGTFAVESPTMVAAVRGTSFVVDADEHIATVSVVKGTVHVTPIYNSELITTAAADATAGQKISIASADLPEYKSGTKKTRVRSLTVRELNETRELIIDLKTDKAKDLAPEVKEEIEIEAPKQIEEKIQEITSAAQNKQNSNASQQGSANQDAANDEAQKEAERKQKEKEAREGAVSIPSI